MNNTVALAQQDRIDRLRLIRSENIGPVTYRQLIARFETATRALDALPDLARRGGRKRSLRIAPASDAEREMEAIAALGGRHIFLGTPEYPLPLANIPDAPPTLTLLGRSEILAKTTIGIVGARNASTNGRRFAQGLARKLAEAGIVIASGLARGIDAAAHDGALAGDTIAILAGGADIVYPAENRSLYEAIRDNGAIVSEMPPGTEPMARHFPSRNRIISGLSTGVVVVEAALRSGSLITARLAGEQGRDVFAVPGFPLDPRAKGTNDLIRNGAILLESAEDILETLQRSAGSTLREPPASEYQRAVRADGCRDDNPDERQAIIDCLGHAPVAVDAVVRDSRQRPATVWTILLELEIAGRLERLPGNRVALIEP
ncbi:MAG: DNA-processing protein DprA [Alphaproteobacteria bacterium]